MRNKVIATIVLALIGLIVFAPMASAQVFYFNLGNNASHSSAQNANPNIGADTNNKGFLNIRNIFYFFTNRYPGKPAPQPEQPNKPAPQPEQPSKPAPQPPASGETNSTVNSEELKMLEYINNERAKVGVAPLQMDTGLARVAEIKSQDMVSKNYFSHTSPTYGDPFNMMRSFGIQYRTAGENIAKNSTMPLAHQALMNSEGHRQNILNPNYTHIGVGIVQNGASNGITVTQMFIGR